MVCRAVKLVYTTESRVKQLQHALEQKVCQLFKQSHAMQGSYNLIGCIRNMRAP